MAFLDCTRVCAVHLKINQRWQCADPSQKHLLSLLACATSLSSLIMLQVKDRAGIKGARDSCHLLLVLPLLPGRTGSGYFTLSFFGFPTL